MNQKKKYVLKPGKHQFAPKSPAVHDNENLSDEEAEWYLEKYPHIARLFTPQPPEGGVIKPKEEIMAIEINTSENQVHSCDHLTPPSGGQGGI